MDESTPRQLKNDIGDIKHSLNYLCTTIDEMKKSNEDKDRKIDNLLKKVTMLETAINSKDRKLADLEEKVNDLEQYTKKNNIIINGLKLKSKSYAEILRTPSKTSQSVTTTSSVEPVTEDRAESVDRPSEMLQFSTMRSRVMSFVKDAMDVTLAESDISAVHELRRSERDTTAPIIVRFSNSAAKHDVMVAKRKLRDPKAKANHGAQVFINDQLTALNGKLFREARMLKKNGRLFSTWTRNGKVYVKRSIDGQVQEIKSLNDI